MATSILVLSRDGLGLARTLREALAGGATIYGPACVVGPCEAAGPSGALVPTAEPGVTAWVGPLRAAFPALWQGSDAIVAVMALGIVVRLAGPLALDKRRDPAVVAVDEAARFAVSVLGGHGGGANALARTVAEALGATAVVTTASEAHGLPAVDLIGRDRGWALERAENLTRVAAAVVRRERVAVYQDAGAPDWWLRFGAWPSTFARVHGPGPHAPAAALVISDRALPEALEAWLPPGRALVYRPPTLVAGIGCKRGTPLGVIEAWADAVFRAHGLAPASLGAVATVTLKADEPALIAFAARRGVPLVAFAPAELEGQAGVERPSERVRARIGIPAVAEAAALRAAGTDRLLVPKQIGPGVTLAVARGEDRRRPEAKSPHAAGPV